MNSFKTIKNKSEGVFREKGSKFLAYAYPVTNDEEIKLHLEELRKEHFGAKHHCYAYRLGPEGNIWRVNDAGEPSNSAGKPILGQLQSRELTNILVVVVRYFGGTLLGMGGLIQAYKGAAAEALNNAEIVEQEIFLAASVETGFDDMNEVMRILRNCNSKISDQQFDQHKVKIAFEMPKSEKEKFLSFVNKMPHKITYVIQEE